MDSHNNSSGSVTDVGHDAGMTGPAGALLALASLTPADEAVHAGITEQARSLMQHFARVSATRFDWMPTHPSEFRYLDLKWYDSTLRLLERCRFRHAGDVRQVQALPPGSVVMPAFARKAVSADGVTQADVFHVQRRFGVRLRNFFKTWSVDRGTRALIFNTELDDGTFFSTVNTKKQFEVEPGLFVQFLAADVLAPVALKVHLEALKTHLAARPGVQPVLVRTLDEQIASENRAQALRAQTRQQRTMTVEELVRLGSEPDLAILLAAEMERLKAQADAERAMLAPGADASLRGALVDAMS